MKKTNLLTLLSILLLICSCNHKDAKEKNEKSDKSYSLKEGQIELKGYPTANHKIAFTATVKTITIDWGDGNVEHITPNGSEETFSHTYSNTNYQTIIITTDSLTKFSSNSCHELRFGNCSELEIITCNGRDLKVLEVNKCKSLVSLYCSNNELTSLDLSGCSALKALYCSHNKLTSLDLSECKALEYLNCYNNQLTSLDLKDFKSLKELNCSVYYYSNKLTSLNISGCSALKKLDCYHNELTSLDLSGCSALTSLNCSHNKLTSLDISGCNALTTLFCYNNKLTAEALNSVFEALPPKGKYPIYMLRINNNPGTSTCNKNTAKEKGWHIHFEAVVPHHQRDTTVGLERLLPRATSVYRPKLAGSIDREAVSL